MSFPRTIAKQCINLAKQYPILTLLGPRQSGKTTLVRELFHNYDYINLEDPEIQLLVSRDPRAILNKYPDRLIIDEIQRQPELLSYIQVLVDEKQKEGMYILTGSHQLALHQAVSQSLAGRTAILELMPLSLSEIEGAGFSLTLNKQLLTGGYPRIYNKQINPTQNYKDYVKTYLERDVRQMINLKDLTTFQRFLKLCAARTGTIINLNEISRDVGISATTIKHWLSILQASFLIVLIPPYFENFGKQMIKSPKMYFTDVGLVCYLLEIETEAQIDRDPLRGNIFETMVVMELIKSRLNQGRDPHLYFYRDSKNHEVDLIYKQGSNLIPIEIKSAQTINKDFFNGLEYFRQLVGPRSNESYLVYAGDKSFEIGETKIINYKNTAVITEQ